MPQFDFSDVKGPEPVPEGTYFGTIVKAEVGESKSGAPKIDLFIEIADGEYQGRKVFDTISFHRNALSFTKRTLEDLGLMPEDEQVELDYLAEELFGLNVEMAVKIDESDQINPATNEPYEPRNRVSRFLNVFE